MINLDDDENAPDPASDVVRFRLDWHISDAETDDAACPAFANDEITITDMTARIMTGNLFVVESLA